MAKVRWQDCEECEVNRRAGYGPCEKHEDDYEPDPMRLAKGEE